MVATSDALIRLYLVLVPLIPRYFWDYPGAPVSDQSGLKPLAVFRVARVMISGWFLSITLTVVGIFWPLIAATRSLIPMYDSVHGYSAIVPKTVPALICATVWFVPPEPSTWRSLPGVIPNCWNAVSAPAVIWSPNEPKTWMLGLDW